jgi:hypothetical protein
VKQILPWAPWAAAAGETVAVCVGVHGGRALSSALAVDGAAQWSVLVWGYRDTGAISYLNVGYCGTLSRHAHARFSLGGDGRVE